MISGESSAGREERRTARPASSPTSACYDSWLMRRGLFFSFVFVFVGFGCAKPQVGSHLREQVSASGAMPVYGVHCVGAPTARRLCAVVLDETEKTPSVPEKAAVSESLGGSTSRTTTWLSEPRPVATRTFTLIARGGSRTVTSNLATLVYDRLERYGEQAPPAGAEEGRIGYVVEELGTWAIEGVHAEARYVDATPYWDVKDHPDSVPETDLAWSRAAPDRSVQRADFDETFVGGRRTLGVVTARIERERGHGRYVSFSYVVEGKLRGEYPCTASGPPRGILVLGDRASWVFSRR